MYMQCETRNMGRKNKFMWDLLDKAASALSDAYTNTCVGNIPTHLNLCLESWVTFFLSLFCPFLSMYVPAKLLQSCPTLCISMDYSLPGASVHGILQARLLEWVAISFSGGSSLPRDQTHISYISCFGRQVLYR